MADTGVSDLDADADIVDWLDALAYDCWKTSEDHGWHAPREIEGVVRDASTTERLDLIHSELSEALEEVRKGRFGTWYSENEGRQKPEGVMVELADALIRIGDLAKIIKNKWPESSTLGEAVAEKMDYNNGRSFRHGGKLL